VAVRRRSSIWAARDGDIIRPTPTCSAATKYVVALADAERQIAGDVLLANGLEDLVAAEAAPERNDGAEQVETVDDLGGLAPGIDLPDAMSVTHDPSLEQARIAGQDDPALGRCDAGDLIVAIIVSPIVTPRVRFPRSVPGTSRARPWWTASRPVPVGATPKAPLPLGLRVLSNERSFPDPPRRRAKGEITCSRRTNTNTKCDTSTPGALLIRNSWEKEWGKARRCLTATSSTSSSSISGRS